ncbi:hypothetical protein BMS3Abin08_00956 [bacterium BMS3Abin08]|nr:hypothetical protein BMS3Abin08_00956 [bacterium BMS3Abin08]
MEDNIPVPRNLTDYGEGNLLPLTQGAEQFVTLRPYEEGVVFLVLGPPYLKDGECVVSEKDVPDLYLCTGRIDDLLYHIGVAARPLVVNADDGVFSAPLDTGTNDAVQLLLHLRITALDCAEIEFLYVFPLDHARCSATPDAYPVCRAADLHNEHARLRSTLFYMPVIYLSHSSGKHDRFDPLTALPVGEPQAEGPRVALNYGFAELVSVIRRAVTCLDLDPEGACKVRWVLKPPILPGQGVSRYQEVSDTVCSSAGNNEAAPSGGMDIPDPPACAGLGAGKGCDTCGEVMCFSSKDYMVSKVVQPERGYGVGPFRQDSLDVVTTDGA